MAKKVIVIGAGAYGLAVGSYLAMNGFSVEIFEMHTTPGGVCTAWKRKGYTFDGCIHWLMGSSPGTALHELWRELHAVQGRRFVEWDEYVTVRTRSGQTLTVFTDPQKLQQEMLRIAPEDGDAIAKLCGAISRLSRVDFPVAMDKMSLPAKARALLSVVPLGPAMKHWGSLDLATFCAGLKSRALAEALMTMYGADGDMPDFPMMGFIMMLAFMHKKSNGYPVGGSAEFARALERRFCELGGTTHYGARVDRIIVENDRAVGIACGPQVFPADIVISCADGHATIFDMLGGAYVGPAIRAAYDTYPVFPSLITVGIGIDRDFSGMPSTRLFPLEKSLVLEDGALTVRQLGVRLFSFDPTMAPAGKTAATTMISTRNHTWWTSLRERDPDAYRRQKERVGQLVVQALETEIGDIAAHVEVVDVATPATWMRYTGNWQGSYEGFLPTRATMMKNLGFTLPGLKGFYMSSQWTSIGGGLPPAAMNGRALARLICRGEGRRFRAYV